MEKINNTKKINTENYDFLLVGKKQNKAESLLI